MCCLLQEVHRACYVTFRGATVFTCVSTINVLLGFSIEYFSMYIMLEVNLTLKVNELSQDSSTVCKLKICGHLSEDNSTNMSDINKIPFSV